MTARISDGGCGHFLRPEAATPRAPLCPAELQPRPDSTPPSSHRRDHHGHRPGSATNSPVETPLGRPGRGAGEARTRRARPAARHQLGFSAAPPRPLRHVQQGRTVGRPCRKGALMCVRQGPLAAKGPWRTTFEKQGALTERPAARQGGLASRGAYCAPLVCGARLAPVVIGVTAAPGLSVNTGARPSVTSPISFLISWTPIRPARPGPHPVFRDPSGRLVVFGTGPDPNHRTSRCSVVFGAPRRRKPPNVCGWVPAVGSLRGPGRIPGSLWDKSVRAIGQAGGLRRDRPPPGAPCGARMTRGPGAGGRTSRPRPRPPAPPRHGKAPATGMRPRGLSSRSWCAQAGSNRRPSV